MASPPLNLAECTATFTPEAHYEYPNRLRYLVGVAQHPKLGGLATMRCLMIERRQAFKTHGDFLELMDDESQEMQEFAVTLFDANSNVRPWIIDGGHRSGSGVWGAELSAGDIVYVEDVTVKEQFRRRGVGSWFLQQLLKSKFVLATSNVMCWPMPPREGPGPDTNWDAKVEGVDKFFRKNGFRRIGRTSFFGYSPDPNHPSHQLAIENDPDRLKSENELAAELNINPEEAQRQYPVHTAIANNKTDGIVPILTAAYASDPAKIHVLDAAGFAPIHIAAVAGNLPALRTLLDLGAGDDLKAASEMSTGRLTPLDGLQDSMRETREFMETILGTWEGYPPDTLACEYLLKKALEMPLIAESEEEYVAKRRLGCTCGACTDQWLSPRMRFRLQVVSEMAYDSMGMDMDTFDPYTPLSSDQVTLLMHSDYIPPPLRARMQKSFAEGYRSLFAAAKHILNAPKGIPKPAHVLAKAQGAPGVLFYFENGGRVDYVLDAIVDVAKGESVLGDGTFESLWDNPAEVGEKGGVVGMPRCANDLAFGLVRLKLGIDPSVRGPYNDDEDDEDFGMYEEDEEDEF